MHDSRGEAVQNALPRPPPGPFIIWKTNRPFIFFYQRTMADLTGFRLIFAIRQITSLYSRTVLTPKGLFTVIRHWRNFFDGHGGDELDYDGLGITNRTGMTDSVRRPLKRRATAATRPTRRSKVASLVVVAGALALLAVALFPASTTTVGHPANVGGNCGPSCHPYRTTSFLTVSGLPAGSYTPGLAYAVTVTLADTNGATGQNNFNFIISTGGGTLATTDPNAMFYSSTQVTPNHLISPMTVSQWTLQWTAPTSGTVTINVWSVMDKTGATGQNAPYDRNTITLTAGSAIPEFPTLLIPVVGIGLAVVVAAMVTRKTK